jgi:outer membrane lipoprotein SlyB
MMRSSFTFSVAALMAVAVSSSAMAQYYDRDAQCRQYAAQAVAPMQQQATANTAGGALLGAGLGAAFGAAVGGGRGAAIGAASGAAVGGVGGGTANSYAVQQAYNSYYYQCMAPPPAPSGYAQPGYAQPGYAPSPYGYR